MAKIIYTHIAFPFGKIKLGVMYNFGKDKKGYFYEYKDSKTYAELDYIKIFFSPVDATWEEVLTEKAK